MKTLEQRLYEAYRDSRGMRLSAADVDSLVGDDAVGTRITNKAATEAGLPESGDDAVTMLCGAAFTWKEFLNQLKESEG